MRYVPVFPPVTITVLPVRSVSLTHFFPLLLLDNKNNVVAPTTAAVPTTTGTDSPRDSNILF